MNLRPLGPEPSALPTALHPDTTLLFILLSSRYKFLMVAPEALPPSCHKGTRGLWLQTVHWTLCLTHRPNCATPRYNFTFYFTFFSISITYYSRFQTKKQGFARPFLLKIIKCGNPFIELPHFNSLNSVYTRFNRSLFYCFCNG